MKFLNIGLSVLILLLAIASAVFSYLLFEKRDQMVDGWGKMAAALNQTSAALDKGSGTNVAKSLSTDALTHEKYADLEKTLPALTQQAQKVIGERDELSAAIKKIADTTEMKDAPSAEDLAKIDGYAASKDKVVGWIGEVKERQDSTLSAVCASASKIGASLSKDALKGAGYADEIGKLDSKISEVKTKVDTYNDTYKEIADTLGSGSPDLGDSSYKDSVQKIASKAKSVKNELASAKNELASAKSKLNSAEAQIASKASDLEKKEMALKKSEGEVKRLANIIKPDVDPKKIIPWEDGSREARLAVQGKVIDINRKYGFLVVDLGTGTKVEQTLGSKLNAVNPKIPAQCDMVVARGLDTDNSQYIGKIKLVKVEEHCSIANIIPGSNGDREVKIGDTVYFSVDSLAQLK
jgi:uncharacterized coiled-coil DUF342 family protein